MRLPRLLLSALVLAALAAPAYAQTPSPTTNPNDTGVGSLNTKLPIAPDTAPQPPNSALDSTKVPDPTDRSTESSPLPPERRALSFPVGAVASIQLGTTVTSATVKNGDPVRGTLTQPMQTSAGRVFPAGTPIQGTVVAAAPAGKLGSAGELSLQLTHVGPLPVVTDVLDFNGQEGHKDVPDSAPAKGTEATVQTGAPLKFHIMENGPVPGLAPNTNPNALNGGPTVGSPALSKQSQPSSQPNSQPNNTPGVNQTPNPGTQTQH